MRYRIDSGKYPNPTPEELETLQRDNALFPVLKIPFTEEEVSRLTNLQFSQLIWVTKILVDKDGEDHVEGEYYSLGLRRYNYRQETGNSESMAEAELDPLLCEMVIKGYFTSFRFGESREDRVVYINAEANAIALTELYDLLAAESRLRRAEVKLDHNFSGDRSVLSVRFDPKRSCLIFGQAECAISPNTLQQSVCRYMFELHPSGDFVDTEKLYEEMGNDLEDEEAKKVRWAALEVNKKTKLAFGFPIFKTPTGQISITTSTLIKP